MNLTKFDAALSELENVRKTFSSIVFMISAMYLAYNLAAMAMRFEYEYKVKLEKLEIKAEANKAARAYDIQRWDAIESKLNKINFREQTK